MAVKREREKKSKIIWTSTLSSNGSGQNSAGMKFRPARETPREETKGKLPCAEAASVQQVKEKCCYFGFQCLKRSNSPPGTNQYSSEQFQSLKNSLFQQQQFAVCFCQWRESWMMIIRCFSWNGMDCKRPLMPEQILLNSLGSPGPHWPSPLVMCLYNDNWMFQFTTATATAFSNIQAL